MSLRIRLILPALLMALTVSPNASEAGFGLYALGDYNNFLSISAVDSFGNATPITSQVVTGGNSLAIDSSGNFYVSTYSGELVEKYSSTGQNLGIFASNLASPDGLAVDKAGNLYVAERASGTVEKFSPTGQDLGTIGSGLNSPSQMVFDSVGTLYVAAGYGVAKFSSTGQNLGFISTNYPLSAIAIDSANDLYAAQYNINGNTGYNILKTSSTGLTLGTIAATSIVNALGVDSSGNLYAAYSGGGIEKFSSTGQDLGQFSSVGAVGLAFAPQPLASVPEPASLMMVGVGLSVVLGFVGVRRSREILAA